MTGEKNKHGTFDTLYPPLEAIMLLVSVIKTATPIKMTLISN